MPIVASKLAFELIAIILPARSGTKFLRSSLNQKVPTAILAFSSFRRCLKSSLLIQIRDSDRQNLLQSCIGRETAFGADKPDPQSHRYEATIWTAIGMR
jgi:hypothetical protein